MSLPPNITGEDTTEVLFNLPLILKNSTMRKKPTHRFLRASLKPRKFMDLSSLLAMTITTMHWFKTIDLDLIRMIMNLRRLVDGTTPLRMLLKELLFNSFQRFDLLMMKFQSALLSLIQFMALLDLTNSSMEI